MTLTQVGLEVLKVVTFYIFVCRYARIFVSVCCRSQVDFYLDWEDKVSFCEHYDSAKFLEWDGTPCQSGMHMDCTTFGTKVSIERGCENIHQWMLRDQLHAYDFVFGCVDGRQACE